MKYIVKISILIFLYFSTANKIMGQRISSKYAIIGHVVRVTEKMLGIDTMPYNLVYPKSLRDIRIIDMTKIYMDCGKYKDIDIGCGCHHKDHRITIADPSITFNINTGRYSDMLFVKQENEGGSIVLGVAVATFFSSLPYQETLYYTFYFEEDENSIQLKRWTVMHK